MAQDTEDFWSIKDSLVALIQFENSRGEPERAAQHLHRALKLAQQQMDHIVEETQRSGETSKLKLQASDVYVAGAQLFYEVRDYSRARQLGYEAVSQMQDVVQATKTFMQSQEVKNPSELRSLQQLVRELQEMHFERLRYLSTLGSESGDYEQAEGNAAEALSLAREMDYRKEISEQLWSLGQVRLAAEKYEEAKECLQDALAEARRWQYSRLTSEILATLGDLFFKQQQIDSTFESFDESLRIARSISSLDLVGAAQYGLAQVASARGEYNEARNLAQDSLSVLESIHNPTAETIKQWLAMLSMVDPPQVFGIQRFDVRLTAPVPEGWHTRKESKPKQESMKIRSPDRLANVIATIEKLDSDMNTLEYAQSNTPVLRQQFPGYREAAFTSTQFPGERSGLLRRYEWIPEDDEERYTVTQIQMYYAENGHGVVATATTRSADFERFELQLRHMLGGLRLE